MNKDFDNLFKAYLDVITEGFGAGIDSMLVSFRNTKEFFTTVKKNINGNRAKDAFDNLAKIVPALLKVSTADSFNDFIDGKLKVIIENFKKFEDKYPNAFSAPSPSDETETEN